jgi:hypothetical protein
MYTTQLRTTPTNSPHCRNPAPVGAKHAVHPEPEQPHQPKNAPKILSNADNETLT